MAWSGMQPVFDHRSAWGEWAEKKLENYPTRLEQVQIEINDPFSLTGSEKDEILRLATKTNFVVYRLKKKDRAADQIPLRLGSQLGLLNSDRHLLSRDGVSAITAKNLPGEQGEYIPYSRQGINWHTDGYYNSPEQKVRALILHCAQPALYGGDNTLVDHEIVFLQLQKLCPGCLQWLQQDNCMTIPANVVQEQELRPEASGPVFSWNHDGSLHMRYTARTRSVRWSEAARQAAGFLQQILQKEGEYFFNLTLQAGEGIIANNVPHNRSAFIDSPGRERLIYRARFYERLQY